MGTDLASTTTTTRTGRPAVGRTAPRRRFVGGRSRKLLLLVHIVSAGAWIGLDVVLAVLVFTAAGTGDVRTRAICLQALELFAVWPMLGAALLTLASGVALGLVTKYGLIRYWWVAVKLVMNVVLAVLIWLALRPGVQQAGQDGRQLADGVAIPAGVGDLLYPPIVSPTLLLVAVVLSIYKPWGRIRRRTS